ncbi:unnamed protein product [Calypogeia fissa]
MASKALFSQLAITILLLLVASKALADPTLIALTEFHIECDSNPPIIGDMLWPMVITIPIGNPPGTTTCSVAKTLPPVGVDPGLIESATIIVYPNPVVGVTCDTPDTCHWAVTPDGIFVHNPATDTEIIALTWQTDQFPTPP